MRSALIHSLPDEVINKTVMQFGDTPIGCSKAIPSLYIAICFIEPCHNSSMDLRTLRRRYWRL